MACATQINASMIWKLHRERRDLLNFFCPGKVKRSQMIQTSVPSSLIYNRGFIHTEVNKSKGLTSKLYESDRKQTKGPLQSLFLQLAWVPHSIGSILDPENP